MLSSSLLDLPCSLACKSFCINVHMVLSYSSQKKYKKMFILTSFVSHLKSKKYQAKTEIISVVVVGSQHILDFR